MVDIIFFGASILQLDFDAQRKVCDFCSTDKEKKGRASVTNLWQMVKNRGCKKKKKKLRQECVLGFCDQRVFTCSSARSGGVMAPQGERAGMAAEPVSLRQLG